MGKNTPVILSILVLEGSGGIPNVANSRSYLAIAERVTTSEAFSKVRIILFLIFTLI
jgi:hypothetical protein